MAEHMILMTVDPKTGDYTLEAKGFQGKGCTDAMKIFAPLGKVENESLKPEYYDSPNSNTISVGG